MRSVSTSRPSEGQGRQHPDGAIDERREHLRRMLRVPARLNLPEATDTVQLIDICRAGVAFASAAPLLLGSAISLSFDLPTSPGTNTVGGDVVYCKQMPQSGLYKIGVRLHSMPAAVVERIVDFVTAPHVS